jgi:hypothetical protein
MRKQSSLIGRVLPSLALAAAASFLALSTSAKVIDDFNGAAKTGWTDSNPAGLPLPPSTQAGGRLTFAIPGIGQPYFVAATKTTETYELKEGRTIEFQVDMVSGLGGDSFAVMGWIPTATGANTLAGYGIAKSETDLLITKGINKYFFDQNMNPAIKNENIVLCLNLAVKGGKVYITGRILDKDDGRKVLWEQTFVDTPAADILDGGEDSPPAPFITSGNFVLYLYADGGTEPLYQVVYDNAEVFVTDSEIVDDFNGATKTGWEDSNPAGLPLPPSTQAGGQLTFAIPGIGQPYFVNATKKTRSFDLAEGTRHEFHVDMVSGLGIDSFVVLGWIPTATGANTLAGYGLAKSESDVLITKGIGKYFYNENLTPPIKNENVRLSLQLTVQHGVVEIRARIYDKDADDAILFDQTFFDTAGADVLADGADSPAAPFITTGNIVLYLYADGGTEALYQVIYDNLGVDAPPAAGNSAPVITDVLPQKGASFLAAPATVSFKASDDKPILDAGIAVILNGTTYTATTGLALTGPATNRTVTLTGLAANKTYAGNLRVVDSDGVIRTEPVWFDTFLASNRTIELEDYNFDAGQFFNSPERTAEGSGLWENSYVDRQGVRDTDFSETRTTPNGGDTMYRTHDAIRMQHTMDQHRPEYNNDFGVYDYDVGDIAAGEWMNYTRNFTAGWYEVYLREAIVGFATAESVLEQVTSDPTQPGQTVKVLGSFLGTTSGFSFRSWPLTDGTGQNVVPLRLSGNVTLRLRQVTPDVSGSVRYLNYLLFLPVQGPSILRAAVASVSPGNNDTVETVFPTVSAVIQNRDTTVKTGTVALKVNGATVTPTVTPTADGATVAYTLSPLPPPNSIVTCRLTFLDSENVEVASDWQFTLTYNGLDAANRQPGPGKDRGFWVRVVQAPETVDPPLVNSLDRAESQLAANSPIPVLIDTNNVEQVINMAQDTRPSGFFAEPDHPESLVLGLDETGFTDFFSVEIRAWLDLPAGPVRFGVVTDDGYKVSSGAKLTDKEPILGYQNGTANETFDFVVPTAGLYPFRMIWYEGGGNAYAELFSVNLTTGVRTLINDPATPGAIKAYRDVVPAPVVKLQSAAAVNGPYADDATATVDTANKRVTVPANGNARFYRLSGASALTIKSTQLQGASIVLTYQ